MLLYDMLMDVNDGTVLFPIADLKHQTFSGVAVPSCLYFPFWTPCWSWRGWVALFRPTGGCLGSCDGCCARGLDTGRPSSAYSVTILAILVTCSLSIWPCHIGTEWQIGTGRKQRRGRVGGVSFRKQALLKPLQNKIKDSCQMLYWAHCSRARKWHYQWWSQRFIATGELKLSFLSISSPRKLWLFYWQSSLLSITTWKTAGRQLGGNIRSNEQSSHSISHAEFCIAFMSLEVECKTESNVFILSPDGC